MSTMSSFRSIKNKHDVYRDRNCMKRFCEFLREHAMKIINFKKKKIKLLTKEQQESKDCYYIWEYRDAAHSICNLKYSVLKNIPIVFHNESKL